MRRGGGLLRLGQRGDQAAEPQQVRRVGGGGRGGTGDPGPADSGGGAHDQYPPSGPTDRHSGTSDYHAASGADEMRMPAKALPTTGRGGTERPRHPSRSGKEF